MSRIHQIFFDTDLRNGLDGLIDIAKKEKVDVDDLSKGEFLVFINSSQTKLKLLPNKNLYANFRSPKGRIDLGMIKHLPECFDGSAIGFSHALKKSLLDKGLKEEL